MKSVIALGHTGAAMAGDLLKTGHDVMVYNHTPAKARILVARGVKLASAVPEVCQGKAIAYSPTAASRRRTPSPVSVSLRRRNRLARAVPWIVLVGMACVFGALAGPMAGIG